jgi:hypothetical protein
MWVGRKGDAGQTDNDYERINKVRQLMVFEMINDR